MGDGHFAEAGNGNAASIKVGILRKRDDCSD